MNAFDWTDLFSKRNTVYTQLVFWLLVTFLYIALKEYPLSFTGASLVCILLQQTLELAVPCYTQNLLILPFFKRGKWALGIALYVVQIVALIFLLPYFLNFVGLGFAAIFKMDNLVDWRQEHIAFSMTAFTIVATLFKIALDRLILDKEQKETELKQLKAQLNPHFLFNTLNNLYGLAVTESKKLPDLMLQLSDLLRYSLYDTNQTYVPLTKELDYMINYVALEKIRLSEKTQISLNIQGDATGLNIAPLMLIVFVENSFKHYSSPRGQKAFINIQIIVDQDILHLNVRNSVDETLVAEKKSRNTLGGIGLANVRKRLHLIYPQNHRLTVRPQPGIYEIDLQINLSEK